MLVPYDAARSLGAYALRASLGRVETCRRSAVCMREREWCEGWESGVRREGEGGYEWWDREAFCECGWERVWQCGAEEAEREERRCWTTDEYVWEWAWGVPGKDQIHHHEGTTGWTLAWCEKKLRLINAKKIARL